MYQWNRTENSEITPLVYGQLLFDKGAKTTQWGETIVFSSSGAVNGYPCGPIAHTKMNSEWINNLIVRANLKNSEKQTWVQIFEVLD